LVADKACCKKGEEGEDCGKKEGTGLVKVGEHAVPRESERKKWGGPSYGGLVGRSQQGENRKEKTNLHYMAGDSVDPERKTPLRFKD